MGKDLKGKELGEGITQRKNGIYEGRYNDRWGKRKSIYNRDLKQLRLDLAEAIAKNYNYSSVRDNVSVEFWFHEWMRIYKEKSVRPNTLREYTVVYEKCIAPYIGNRLMTSLVKTDIQRLIDIAVENGYTYERQNKIRVLLKDMFQRAIEDQLLVTNPASGVKVRTKKIITAETLTVEEQRVFLKFAENTFYESMYQVAVNTGLRPGELFALNRSDIDFESGMINVDKTLVYQKYLTDDRKVFHIEDPKTAQSVRKVPMNAIVRKYIKRQLELKAIVEKKNPREQNDYIFVTKFNTPLNSQIYNQSIESIINSINLLRDTDNQFPKFTGHTLRHTFATRCIEQGIAPKVVQTYLGHASLKMTMDLYVHMTEDIKVNEIEKIVDISATDGFQLA